MRKNSSLSDKTTLCLAKLGKQIVSQQKNKVMKAKEITTDYFKQHVFDYVASPNEWKFIGQRPAIIDFYAKWCGPCKGMAPHLDQIAEEFEGKLDVYKVDVDQEVELTEVFGVRSMPTLLFIPQEGLPQKAVGALTYGQLKEVIEDILLPKA